MTVEELITELKKFPPEMRVVTGGYEYGLEDASPVRVVKAKLDVNVDTKKPSEKAEWWAGRHGLVEDPESEGFTDSTDVVAIGDIGAIGER